MQTVAVRFLPSASPGVTGYSLSVATVSGGYVSGAQIDIPVGAARAESGGVLAYDVQMTANVPHYLAMRAYSMQTASPYSNEIVIPAVAAAATSSTSLAMTAATGESTGSPSGATSSGSGSASMAILSGSGSASGSSDTSASTASAASAAAMSSLDFDGAGEYLASSAALPLGASSEFTVSLWALADPQASGGRVLLSLRGGGQSTQNRVELSADATSLQMTAYNDAGQLVYDAIYSAALVPGSWQHLALTFDGQVDSAPLLLIDGMTRAPTSANLTGNAPVFTDSAGRVFVGGGSGASGTWFGAIGHVALFGAALGDDEIDEISLRGHTLDLHENSGAYQASDALLHYWRLGEDPSAVGYDSGLATVPIDLDDPAGYIDAADIVADAPVLLP